MRFCAVAVALTTIALSITAGARQEPAGNAVFFQTTVGPLIRKRCVFCHNARDHSGGLDLSGKAAALKGGNHRVAWVPGDPAASLLYQRVSSRQMPPGMPLAASEVEAFRRWIASGAVWADAALSPVTVEPKRAGPDWWSLRQPRLPAIPAVKNPSWVRNPIDAFVLANLERHGLRPAPPADRRTLIRRVTFDLLGVPPTPAEIDSFLRDQSSNSYEKLVDRLLADSRYGERWGRHWLDVARFAESQGFERDVIRDHAWPYRDYVIRSLNADKPYNEFVREQIAGDVLPHPTADSIAATGFLVAGPFDEAGNGSASAVLRAQVREEELEDMLGTVGQTFLGLTVNCARCHDHKFDPILQRDYYRLKAAFEGVHGGDRSSLPPAEAQQQETERARLQQRADELTDEIHLIEAGARNRAELWDVPGVPIPLARWSFTRDTRDDFGGLQGTLHGGAAVVNGRLRLNGQDAYLETSPLLHDLRAKTLEAWVVLPDREQRGGGVLSIQTSDFTEFDALVYGERQPKKWVAGSALFQRTHDLEAPLEAAPPEAPVHVAVVYEPNSRITVYRDGLPYAPGYVPDGPNGSLRTFAAGKARVLLGLRHVGAANGFLAGEILEARLYDRALTPDQVLASFRAGTHKGSQFSPVPRTAEQARRLVRLTAERDQLQVRIASLLPATAYAAQPQAPGPTYLLLRGDVQAHGDLMSAGGVTALGAADFGLRPDAPEHERRLRFADWLVRPDNALTARVMVNRVWHYHFGRGIVGTPNDFGYNGETPSHPELLDWLASVFMQPGTPALGSSQTEIETPTRDTKSVPGHVQRKSQIQSACNWRLKPLHRLIVLSNTYRQSALFNAKAAAHDSEDRWLWRFSPRRLEGEAVRDAMLCVSGRINWAQGGPGFRPFVETVNNSHFYAVFDKDGPEYNRRTVYRINVDSAKSTLLETLDCPDPSTKTPRRSVTTTPLQALELMNNRFVLEQARYFGQRVRAEAGARPADQADRAYLLALGRPPTAEERSRASTLIGTGSVTTLCWALLNSSEFLYMR